MTYLSERHFKANLVRYGYILNNEEYESKLLLITTDKFSVIFIKESEALEYAATF